MRPNHYHFIYNLNNLNLKNNFLVNHQTNLTIFSHFTSMLTTNENWSKFIPLIQHSNTKHFDEHHFPTFKIERLSFGKLKKIPQTLRLSIPVRLCGKSVTFFTVGSVKWSRLRRQDVQRRWLSGWQVAWPEPFHISHTIHTRHMWPYIHTRVCVCVYVSAALYRISTVLSLCVAKFVARVKYAWRGSFFASRC